MKSLLIKTTVFCTVSLSVLTGISFGQTSTGQENDRVNRRAANAASSIYVISAKAGGVNYVEGKVAVARKLGKSGYLIKGDEIQVGDKVTTGADGKAEILLNPGSYARLGENTEFELVTDSTDDLKLKVTRGSVVFEVIADKDFRIAVNVPNSDFYLVRSGIYRVDAVSNGEARIEVWKGGAQVGDGKTEILKSGQAAEVKNGATNVAKFERDDKDALEKWSKDRSKVLAKINSSLDSRTARSTLLANYGRWNLRDSFGLWMFDASIGSFCFFPYGYGWRSPYGYWFGRDLWGMQLPYYVYYPNNTGGGNSNGGGTQTRVKPRWNSDGNGGNNNGNANAGDGGRVKERANVTPPYVRVQRDMGGDNSVFAPSGIDRTSPMIPSRVERSIDNFPSRIESTPVSAPPASAPVIPRGKDN